MQISTTKHHHVHLNENGCLMGHLSTESARDDDHSLSVNSDEEQEFNHGVNEDDEDDEEYEENEEITGDEDDEVSECEEHIDNGTHSGCFRCVAHQRCTLVGGHDGIASHDLVEREHHFDCEEHVLDPRGKTVLEISHSDKFTKKSRSRLRDFACKAKEHLRDEENRRKAMDMIQSGVREVTTFIAEVQASDKSSGASNGAKTVAKGNGKKLAKVCVKVAMQRLAN